MDKLKDRLKEFGLKVKENDTGFNVYKEDNLVYQIVMNYASDSISFKDEESLTKTEVFQTTVIISEYLGNNRGGNWLDQSDIGGYLKRRGKSVY